MVGASAAYGPTCMICTDLPSAYFSSRRVAGGFRVETAEGELVHRHDADPRTGVIDMWSGPDADHLECYPTRVVPLPDGRSLFLFTALQHAGIDHATFARTCALIPEELATLRTQLVGSGRR